GNAPGTITSHATCVAAPPPPPPRGSTTVTLTSSQNPSQFAQPVTFTATVTGSSPTGTVTFMDGVTVLATVPLNAAGQPTFTTSCLRGGTHSITASYSGDAKNAPSTSAPLLQAVNTDSAQLRALQLAVTKIEAQSSGQAISGAIDAAIGEGFAGNSAPVTF